MWTPDVRGSIAFLVASALAFADVDRPWLAWRPRDLGWSVAMLNMVGSIAFGVSALAAWVNPTTGDVAAARLDNLGTLVGAICFFFGALLLIPDQAGSSAAHDPSDGPDGSTRQDAAATMTTATAASASPNCWCLAIRSFRKTWAITTVDAG